MYCLTCRFCDEIEVNREKQKVCRLNPPQVVLVPVRTLQGEGLAIQRVFPPVQDADFCGKYSELTLKGGL